MERLSDRVRAILHPPTTEIPEYIDGWCWPADACNAESPNEFQWVCSEHLGHSGPHIARDDGQLCEDGVWD